MWILGGRRSIHALRAQLVGREILVLHRGRRSVGEALLLLEAELGLLRRGLRSRQGEVRAGRVSFLGYRGHWVGARAIHLGSRDGARVDEARGVVEPVLGGLKVHGVRLRRAPVPEEA